MVTKTVTIAVTHGLKHVLLAGSHLGHAVGIASQGYSQAMFLNFVGPRTRFSVVLGEAAMLHGTRGSKMAEAL